MEEPVCKDGQYLTEICHFIAEYSSFYDFKVTEFFSSGAYSCFPKEWEEVFFNITNDKLNQVPFGYIEENWPETLKSFISTSLRLSKFTGLVLKHNSDPHILPQDCHGMNPKKCHEVSRMAGVIGDICMAHHCGNIVDVGSGLGYLDGILSHQLGYDVLGIEGYERRSHDAQLKVDLSKKRNSREIGNFQSVPLQLQNADSTTVDNLNAVINDHFANIPRHTSIEKEDHCYLSASETDLSKNLLTNCKKNESSTFSKMGDSLSLDFDKTCNRSELASSGVNDGVCLIGLHCCGDLTPIVLQLFARIPKMQCLLCVGCCYHKMSRDVGESYKYFPLSEKLKSIMEITREKYPDWKISTYALRLAAQETRSRWRQQTIDDHEFHVKNVAFRGIIELFSKLQGDWCFRGRRKKARRGDYANFETYLEFVLKSQTGVVFSSNASAIVGDDYPVG